MATCSSCLCPLPAREARRLQGLLLCEDCYLDRVGPRPVSVQYPGAPDNFMRRLKRTFSAIKQDRD